MLELVLCSFTMPSFQEDKLIGQFKMFISEMLNQIVNTESYLTDSCFLCLAGG